VLYVAPEHPEGKQVVPEDIANEVTEIMVGDVTEGIAKDASLEDRPVAGKTGTSENFFDAWFIGYTPELVTGMWMGYAAGGDTLEYVLDYARKLHGLSGGIAPAQIWKSYTKVVLEGEPIEQFDGVEIPETEEQPQAKEPVARKHAPAPARVLEPAPGPRRAAAASASASSVAPARAKPARAERPGAAGYRAARSSASAAPR
jgi:membrane peptidoglycan carboxypeptidase